MKQFLFIISLFASIAGHCQFFEASNNQLNETTNITAAIIHDSAAANSNKEKIKLKNDGRWRLDKNKLWTGGLVMLSGMAKGFNETLEFNWHGFAAVFPKANPQWFWPQKSFKNKYKDGDPEKGAKFPLSTCLYHRSVSSQQFNSPCFYDGCINYKNRRGQKEIKAICI